MIRNVVESDTGGTLWFWVFRVETNRIMGVGGLKEGGVIVGDLSKIFMTTPISTAQISWNDKQTNNSK